MAEKSRDTFTGGEWKKINDLLDANGAKFGFPARKGNSVVMASFNIRKLGKEKSKTDNAWKFLARFCQQCDLVAIQEVLDDMEGLRKLLKICNKEGDYRILVSDNTGGVASGGGMNERLAFLYNLDTMKRMGVASDITIDRSAVLNTLYGNRGSFEQAFDDYQQAFAKAHDRFMEKMEEFENGERSKKPSFDKPPFVLPEFLTFIRTPHCASFQVKDWGNDGFEFLAVNAHLLYGDKSRQKEERRMEFIGLTTWLAARARQENRHPKDMILFGDLNLDFDDPEEDEKDIVDQLTTWNKGKLKGFRTKINFPFFDVHEGQDEVFRSNARLTQTYDQIAFFIHEKKRLPKSKENAKAGGPGKFDYGMFNFVELFAAATENDPAAVVRGRGKTAWSAFLDRFQHGVSDHMPIWVRLPTKN